MVHSHRITIRVLSMILLDIIPCLRTKTVVITFQMETVLKKDKTWFKVIGNKYNLNLVHVKELK